ncbi:MAG: 3-alpha,7-alpha,12-alpha-trihydroxy-5-beta-cholest-24-enoyl-CoA hydratase [Coriobacteriia bacterium]|nr:3-alpha,7-alpha,12-alpha-trihydroxy-5-beta-cholest-24-enoyl-CoA hydratase [Coriobacteriia bacterium]
MTISTEIVGKEFGPFVREYTFRDLEICALGCGAAIDGKKDLEYVFEGDAKNPQLKVLPIFGVPLTCHEEMTKTLDYGYNYAGSLHFGFEILFHAPFKMADRIETFVTQEALYDRGEGRGSLSKQVGRSYSADGTHLCTVETWDVCIFDGGWGGPTPPKDIVDMPDREPDAIVEEVFPLNQPLIFRLMGDWHEQHVDWSYTEQTGLDRPIAHAISYAGLVMLHAIASFFPGEPERMTRFKTRVTSPLVPGTKLHTRMWKVGEKELRFQLVDADADETGAKPHLNWGIIEWD